MPTSAGLFAETDRVAWTIGHRDVGKSEAECTETKMLISLKTMNRGFAEVVDEDRGHNRLTHPVGRSRYVECSGVAPP